jgi:hypothetical protein
VYRPSQRIIFISDGEQVFSIVIGIYCTHHPRVVFEKFQFRKPMIKNGIGYGVSFIVILLKIFGEGKRKVIFVGFLIPVFHFLQVAGGVIR